MPGKPDLSQTQGQMQENSSATTMEEHPEPTFNLGRASKCARLPAIAILILMLLVAALAAMLVAEKIGYAKNREREIAESETNKRQIQNLKALNQQYQNQITKNYQEIQIKNREINILQQPSNIMIDLRALGSNITELASKMRNNHLPAEELARYVDFQDIGKQMEKIIDYQQFRFPYDQDIENLKQISLSGQEQMPKITSQLGLNLSQDFQQKLAIELAQHRDQKESNLYAKLLQLEIAKAQQKYEITKTLKTTGQQPICIFIQEDISSTSHNIKLMEELSNLNYSNFHVVYVQDSETSYQQQHHRIRQYLTNSRLRIKNNLTLVRSPHRQGTTSNTYFLVRKLCRQDDIVFLLGKGSTTLGRQALRVLNSVYQGGVEYATSGVLGRRSEYDLVSAAGKLPEEVLSKFSTKYAKKYEIRSFRKKVLDAIPIQKLLQFRLNILTGLATPTFFQTESTSFPLYTGLQSSAKGTQIPQFLQLSQRTQPNCEQQHRSYLNASASISTSVQQEKQGQALGQCLERYREKLEFQLLNPVRVVRDGKIYKRTIYNQKAIYRSFGRQNKFLIDLKKYIKQVTNDWRSFKSGEVRGPRDIYYVLTPKDYELIIRSNQIDFEKLKLDFENSIPFEILQFEEDKTINMTPPMLKMQAFNSSKQVQNFLTNELPLLDKELLYPEDTLYRLGVQMQTNSTSPHIIQAEYYLTNKRFNLDQQLPSQQVPICIISTEYNVYNRENGSLFRKYFQALEALNYTNYHVVYIDDFSSDGNLENIYHFVNNSSMKVKNRMKIVHTLKNVGITANLFFWPQKMCSPEEVVVLIDADDNILGRQPLKVFSHYYSNPEIWYTFSRHIVWHGSWWIHRGGTFGDRNVFVRRTKTWAVSNTRTFRSDLMRAVPIYQFLEYHYSLKDFIAWPVFQDLSADGVQISAHVELAGNDRIAYYDGMTYGYSGTSGVNKCYELIEKYDWRKTMSRTRLARLDSLKDKGKMMDNDQFPEMLYSEAKTLSNQLSQKKCIKK